MLGGPNRVGSRLTKVRRRPWRQQSPGNRELDSVDNDDSENGGTSSWRVFTFSVSMIFRKAFCVGDGAGGVMYAA